MAEVEKGCGFDRYTWDCLEDAIKGCLMCFHENQAFVDCYRDACWSDKELACDRRVGVNIMINSEARSQREQDKFVGSGRADECAMMDAQLVIQHFAVACLPDAENVVDRSAYIKARQMHSMVLKRLMECWKGRKAMQWDGFMYNGGTMTVQQDVREASKAYAVFDTQYLLKYRMDTCRPDKIIRANCNGTI